MFKSKSSFSCKLAALAVGMAVGLAARPAGVWAADATQPGAAPEIAEAVKQLGTNDNQAMEEALAKLQGAMVQQARQAIVAQQLMLRLQDSLAKQLKLLTGSGDARVAAHTAGLLEFNAAVYRWAVDVAALPDENRDAVFNWGLAGDNLALVAKIYGRDPDVKIDAIHALAKMGAGPATDFMIQMLLNDRDREASLLTIDAIYGRKMSPAMIDALCDKAFGWQLNQIRQRQTQQQMHVVTVHGRTVNWYDNQFQNINQQDADYVVDLLLTNKDPHTAERLDSFFDDVLLNTNGVPGNAMNIISPNYSGSAAMSRLIEAFKPKGAVLLCEKVLESSNTNGNDQTMMMDGTQVKFRISPRADAAALLVRITGQDAGTYGFSALPNYTPTRWGVMGGAAEENDMLKKLHGWLADHGKEYGLDAVGAFPETPTAGSVPPGRGRFGGNPAPVAPPAGLP